MRRRSNPGDSLPYAERKRLVDKANRDYFGLLDKARLIPESRRSNEEIAERVRKHGHRMTAAQAAAIIEAYERRPHICPVLTGHWFGGACRLGTQHPGCCPGECPAGRVGEEDK